jgi:hypothetical protein
MLPAVALEILDRADLERVLPHVQHCAECARLLEDYRKVTAGLGLLLPCRDMDPARAASLRARLLARTRRDRNAKVPDPILATVVPGAHGPAFLAGRWTGWTVAAALAGVLLMHHAVHRPLDYGWLAAGALTVFLVALGLYASVQRGRLSVLQNQLAAFQREEAPPESGNPAARASSSGPSSPAP